MEPLNEHCADHKPLLKKKAKLLKANGLNNQSVKLPEDFSLRLLKERLSSLADVKSSQN
jgi:hypothetical protein